MQNLDVLVRRAEVVRIHFDNLEELVNTPKPGVREALHASLALRFLFDGALAALARQLDHSISVHAPTLENVPFEEAILFACGGYRLGASMVKPHFTYREPGLTSPHRSQFDRQIASSPSTYVFSNLKLSKFMMQPCLAFVGKAVSREATIRYVANKCGGAHHHDDLAGFDELDMRLTTLGHILRFNGDELSAVFLETLGTASLLLASDDIVALRRDLAK
ncbi:hypothetical protein [Devosia sp. CAU 1758]